MSDDRTHTFEIELEILREARSFVRQLATSRFRRDKLIEVMANMDHGWAGSEAHLDALTDAFHGTLNDLSRQYVFEDCPECQGSGHTPDLDAPLFTPCENCRGCRLVPSYPLAELAYKEKRIGKPVLPDVEVPPHEPVEL